MPSHGANSAVIHARQGLNIPTISELCLEVQSMSLARCRTKADVAVNDAIDSCILRGSIWQRRSSYAVRCDSLVTSTSLDPAWSWSKSKRHVKDTIIREKDCYWSDVIKPLVFQGDLLKLISEEKNNITWKSVIYSLPKRRSSQWLN